MPIGITTSKNQHRTDTPIKPVISASGLTGVGRLLLADQFSTFIYNAPPVLTWSPLNRTYENAPAKIYQEYGTTWTSSAGVIAIPLGLEKTGPDGFSGAYTAGEYTGTMSVEGRSASAAFSTGISLQSGTVSYIPLAPNEVEHALMFGNGGIGEIYEMGMRKLTFHHEVGDSGLIIRENDIVKYFVIRGDSGALELLRSTRSKLLAAARPVVFLYHAGAKIDQLLIGIGETASTSISVYSTLTSDFQDWENASSIESLAEKTMNKDKREDFTYFSEEKNIITLSLNLAWREEEDYQKFREFYQWHDLDRPFIFIDSARAKLPLQSRFPLKDNEMFARFVSSWKDNPIGGYLYGVSVDIRQVIEPPTLIFNA